MRLLLGDCLDVLAGLPERSVDAVVTDPPYDLTAVSRGGSARQFVDNPYGRTRIGIDRGFMGKTWDGTGVAFQPATWAAVLRVMKPGAHLVAFGGTRTHHRLICAIEDAGFEIRDCLMWLYGSGFPKSHNLHGEHEGWGTALKPAWEPIVLARAPLSEGTVAANVARWGTGALNIDGARIGTDPMAEGRMSQVAGGVLNTNGRDVRNGNWRQKPNDAPAVKTGRWPANLVLQHSLWCESRGTVRVRGDGHYPAARGRGGLSTNGHTGQDGLTEASTDGEPVEMWDCPAWADCPVALLDAQSGNRKAGGNLSGGEYADIGYNGNGRTRPRFDGYQDTGGASRFFFTAKASKAEREAWLSGTLWEPRPAEPANVNDGRETSIDNPYQRGDTPRRNTHPTVKPLALMRYLVKLVTPPGGVVLDPFMGSGSTGLAAQAEGCDFIGIEREPEYLAIARRRLGYGEAEAACGAQPPESVA